MRKGALGVLVLSQIVVGMLPALAQRRVKISPAQQREIERAYKEQAQGNADAMFARQLPFIEPWAILNQMARCNEGRSEAQKPFQIMSSTSEELQKSFDDIMKFAPQDGGYDREPPAYHFDPVWYGGWYNFLGTAERIALYAGRERGVTTKIFSTDNVRAFEKIIPTLKGDSFLMIRLSQDGKFRAIHPSNKVRKDAAGHYMYPGDDRIVLVVHPRADGSPVIVNDEIRGEDAFGNPLMMPLKRLYKLEDGATMDFKFSGLGDNGKPYRLGIGFIQVNVPGEPGRKKEPASDPSPEVATQPQPEAPQP